MFVWNKEDLNEEQELAILEKESLLLIACPGSGKTRTLTYKIAYELSLLKSLNQFIIALTYTNVAADEIKERIDILGVNTSKLWIGTIHSFCLEWILRPYSLYLENLKNGFQILNSSDSQKIITELCKPYKKEKITYWDCSFIATLTGFKMTSSEKEKRPYIKKVLEENFRILKENRQIDFEQILSCSYQLLKKRPVINTILSNLFPFILIDEFQDTKEIQYAIISSILRESKKSKVLFVGDPNQSIYENLGGFPMDKNDIEKRLGFSLTQLSLTRNYRSSTKIINYFDFYKTFPNTIIPTGKHKEYDSVITFNNEVKKDDLFEEIIKLIEFNIKTKKISPNEICIAAPQWVHLASLTRNLISRLPEYEFNGPGMAPFSRDIENFWYRLARIVLTEPSPNLYIRRLRWSKDILEELDNIGVDVSSTTNKQFLKLCNSIIIDETGGLSYLDSFFKEICSHLAISIEIFPTLKEHYEAFFNSSKIRIERIKKEGSLSIDSIEYFRKAFKPKKGITISTIHGTKGEEYDVVIGFGLLNEWVPHFSDKKNGVLNSKKMLYVLSSRARKNLHIISETNRKVNKHNPHGLQPTSHLISYNYSYDEIEN